MDDKNVKKQNEGYGVRERIDLHDALCRRHGRKGANGTPPHLPLLRYRHHNTGGTTGACETGINENKRKRWYVREMVSAVFTSGTMDWPRLERADGLVRLHARDACKNGKEVDKGNALIERRKKRSIKTSGHWIRRMRNTGCERECWKRGAGNMDENKNQT